MAARQIDELSNTLKDRGALHISDLEDKDYNRSLKLKGGTGYTKRLLDEEWSILDTSFTSFHPIPELKDRVLHLSDTVQALCEKKQAMALEMDKTNEELTKLDSKVMSTIYSEGDKAVKVFKKTPGWSATPQ